MESKQVFVCSNGKIKQDALKAVQAIPSNDPLMVVTVEEHKETRSGAQNRLYWKWVRELCDFYYESTGRPVLEESVHDDLRASFLGYDETTDIFTGMPKRVLKSTKKLKVKEFADYLNKIHAHAVTTWGLTLTIPPEMQRFELIEKVVEVFDGEECR